MPLKLAAVLQRSKDHPDQINRDIEDYWEMFTHGNKYVGLNLDEAPDNFAGDYERNLIDYVKNMGFDDSSVILVDKEWDVEPEEVKVVHVDLEADAPGQPWAEVGQAVWNAAPINQQINNLHGREVIWARG